MRQHRFVVADALKKLLASERKPEDRIENLLIQSYFSRADLRPVIDVTSDTLAALVASSTNPARPCVWETKATYDAGQRTIAETSDHGLVEPLLACIGEHTHF